MPQSLPEELHLVLASLPDSPAGEEAWATFTRRFSPLLLHAVRWGQADHDAVMDRYAFVLERLREEGGARLRAFHPDGRASFGTWLVVVARRLSLDWERHRRGRPRNGTTPARQADQEARRRLLSLMGEKVDLTEVEDRAAQRPDDRVLRDEARTALDAALSALDHRDRLLIRLRFTDDASVRDIARLMAFPSQFHVYRKLNEVLERLRDALKGRGIEAAG